MSSCGHKQEGSCGHCKIVMAAAQRLATITPCSCPECAEIRDLRTALTAAQERERVMREALEACQWGDYNRFQHETCCPECGGLRSGGHEKDCIVGAALAPKGE